MPPLHRRTFVTSLATAPAALALPSDPCVSVENTAETFQHGVASGDPDRTSVIIWTRITTIQDQVETTWELATDPEFSQIVSSGNVAASKYRDHTVKVLVKDLKPDSTYYYRFHAQGATSLNGRTRTLPKGKLTHLGLAIASCSNYAFGFFNAYAAIARDKQIDFVLHLGDYIYEYGADGWGADTAATIDRQHQPAHEIVSLIDYRQRHAQYKTDNGSKVMHAAHPLLLVWDDHESANNPWLNGAQNHSTQTEGLWRDRRAAALRAYYEWMPVRDPEDHVPREDFWRHYRFGDLATLTTLESRHTARAEQIDYTDHFANINSAADARAFERNILAAADRPMLSPAMESFLEDCLRASVEDGTTWRLIGNAIPMARTPVPELASMGFQMPASKNNIPGTSADLFWKGQYNLPFYLDTWDGYPWARQRFYRKCADAGARDLIVLTGDSHSFWANTLSDDQGQAMGVEIGTAGVSSPGDFVEQGFSKDVAAKLDEAFSAGVPAVRWTDNLHQGYVRLTIHQTVIAVDYIAVNTVLTEDPSTRVIHRELLRKTGSSVAYTD